MTHSPCRCLDWRHIDTENGPSDEEGEKEAKRQRSEPTTPISTSSRLPYEYDEVMGITQVDPREADSVEEGLNLEYHDASENSSVPEPPDLVPKPDFSHGGCGSSSLRECIELLNNTEHNAPAALHSRVKKENRSDPRQVMSPNVEEKQITAQVTTSGSMPSDELLPKDEPQSRGDKVKSEVLTPKLEPSTLDVKEEMSEPDATDTIPDTLNKVQEDRETQPLDSEDSFSQERVADELRRLTETQQPAPSGAPYQSPEGGATAPVSEGATAPTSARNRQGATAPESARDREDSGSHAPQRSGRYQGKLRSPDPYLFNSTIWIRHDSGASARAHEDPMDQMRDRVYAMEHNLETLRTRLTQVAGLRDAQDVQEDHRAIVAQLNEVEECASVHTLREFMPKILRLESMLSGENGGAIGEAIRACNRRIDNHRDVMDDFYARISIQDWYHDISDQEGGAEAENQPGMENRPPGRRKLRGHAPQRRSETMAKDNA